MKLIPLKSKKAQAAMTDSLFFLTIIVALCVLLFKFSAVYGDRVDLAMNNLYFKEYTNSTIKTIYYTDMPLDFHKDIENSKETDYLITAIKSDYIRFNGKIGSSQVNELNSNNEKNLSKYNLFYTIKALMTPLPNYDYIFYIEERSGNYKYLFFMLKINNIDESNNEITTEYYLCEPVGITTVRNMVQRSSQIYSSSTPLIFKTYDGREVDAISNLTIWASTKSINKDYIEYTFQVSENLKCNLYGFDFDETINT